MMGIKDSKSGIHLCFASERLDSTPMSCSPNIPTPAAKLAKPDWIRVKAPQSEGYKATRELMRANKLNTVCEEAACPNIGECWSKGHATVMILGDTCTRACAFCNIKTGVPNPVDPEEPRNLALAISKLGLAHVVITSVDRDDLDDGGANHFARSIEYIRTTSPDTTIEILTPDFRRKDGNLEIVVRARPDVFNHNIETVPRLYQRIRPGARYFHSLNLLKKVKELDDAFRKQITLTPALSLNEGEGVAAARLGRPPIFTKSGIMVGLGETKEEVLQVMDDFRSADIDFITIGQYLQPTPNHAPVDRFVTPEEFHYYERVAKTKGFLMVSATPLTRSSYHADADFAQMRDARNAKLLLPKESMIANSSL